VHAIIKKSTITQQQQQQQQQQQLLQLINPRTKKNPSPPKALYQEIINSFQAIAWYTRQEKGSFFTGAYLPKKLVLSPPIERQYLSIQKHVSS
jgi:hypothetical protein